MTVSEKWGDLMPRILSACVLLAVGGGALWLGGIAFGILVLALVAVIHWEITRMLTPLSRQAHWFSAVFAAGTLSLTLILSPLGAGIAVAIGVLIQRSFFHTHKTKGMLFSLAIVACGYVLLSIRADFGLAMAMWFLGVVVMTDIAGYFAGRILGGPKFWPRYSPKKTWSGAIGGWAAAMVFTLVLTLFVDLHQNQEWLVLMAFFLSFASQMGDISQSALKRACNIKDSSTLIPGHGGFFDRFDGVIGATVAFGLLAHWVMY